MKSGVRSYPFWRPDFRQNPFALPAQGVRSLIEGMPQNQTPLRDSRMSDVRVIMLPRNPQDTRNIPQGDRMQSGVANPGGLTDRLMAGVARQSGRTQ